MANLLKKYKSAAKVRINEADTLNYLHENKQ